MSDMLGKVVALGVLGGGLYYLYHAFTTCGWPFDGSFGIEGDCGGSNNPPAACTESQTRCDSSRNIIQKCLNGVWTDTSDPCGSVSGLECQMCACEEGSTSCISAYCPPTFSTPEELNTHMRACHSSGSFYEDWFTNVAYPHGAQEVQLWFCQPMVVTLIEGFLYQADHVRAGCNNDAEIDGMDSMGRWVVLVPRQNFGLAKGFTAAPGITLQALRFRTAIGGGFLSCGISNNWDFARSAGLSQITANITMSPYHGPTEPVETRVCDGLRIGWYVDPTKWKTSAPKEW